MGIDENNQGNDGERVGRVRLDVPEAGPGVPPVSEQPNLPAAILLGVIAVILMVGAMLLILSGVFAQ